MTLVVIVTTIGVNECKLTKKKLFFIYLEYKRVAASAVRIEKKNYYNP